jgi:hypothetical protein
MIGVKDVLVLKALSFLPGRPIFNNCAGEVRLNFDENKGSIF